MVDHMIDVELEEGLTVTVDHVTATKLPGT
jgi:hypothetical protein